MSSDLRLSAPVAVTAVLVSVAVVLLSVGQVYGQQCSGDACVQILRTFLTRTDFWFGDSYSRACPDTTSEKSFVCTNPDQDHKTIISRVLQEPDFDVRNISQSLHIRFYVPAGSYRACGHTFLVPAAFMSQDLEVSEEASLDSWTMQTRPAVTWDPQPGAVYALATYSLDRVQLAGLWVNIQGGDSALGVELVPYSGPLSALDRTSFHTFLLFRQRALVSDGQLGVAKKTIQNGVGVVKMALSDLRDMLGQSLEPKGAGLISTGADPYGIEKHKSLTLYNNCPWLIARMRPTLGTILEVHNLTALGADASSLEVEVEVTYYSEAVTVTACCKTSPVSARTFQIDALSPKPVPPVHVTSTPLVRLSAVNMMDTVFFFDTLYTIILLDVTWAAVSPGQRRTSLLWQVTDIPGQYVSSGRVQKEYTPPIPPQHRSGNSLYTFFIFRQSGTFRNYTVAQYCSNTSTRPGACDFNLHNFVLENRLRLAGINWFWSQPDLYSRGKLYENDVDQMDAACRGVTGYSRPCPDKCAPPAASASTPSAPDRDTNKQGGGAGSVSVNEIVTLFVPVLGLALGSVVGIWSRAC